VAKDAAAVATQVLVVSSFAFQGFYKRGRFTLPAPWALGMMPEDPDPDVMKPERLDYAAAVFDGLISTTRCFIRGWSL
jgi:hypothetical protein